jgi:hypothetical protein
VPRRRCLRPVFKPMGVVRIASEPSPQGDVIFGPVGSATLYATMHAGFLRRDAFVGVRGAGQAFEVVDVACNVFSQSESGPGSPASKLQARHFYDSHGRWSDLHADDATLDGSRISGWAFAGPGRFLSEDLACGRPHLECIECDRILADASMAASLCVCATSAQRLGFASRSTAFLACQLLGPRRCSRCYIPRASAHIEAYHFRTGRLLSVLSSYTHACV